MSLKIRNIVLYVLFSAMLVMAGYVIFFTKHSITDSKYFYLTAAAFIMALLALATIVFFAKAKDKRKYKIGAAVCIILIIFQVVSLPFVNLFSQTLPAGPRGTIYQFPKFSNSIAQNDVGLMMRYYLNGKTLNASEDFPKKTHNGFLFITDEYDFVKGDYPILEYDKAKEFSESYKTILSVISVQENPKLKIPSFKIYISNQHTDELILLTDEKSNWYFMTRDVYAEAFGE